jgi:hypothetical protein
MGFGKIGLVFLAFADFGILFDGCSMGKEFFIDMYIFFLVFFFLFTLIFSSLATGHSPRRSLPCDPYVVVPQHPFLFLFCLERVREGGGA